jgi:hypothetical protein
MAEYMNYESFRELLDSFVRKHDEELEKAIYLGTTSPTEIWWRNRKIAEEPSDDVQTVEFD